jgi:hypothetical protein
MDEAMASANDVVGSGPYRSEEYWREQVRAWKVSGLTQARFCKERGLSPFGFGKWKVRIEGPGPRGGARLVRLGIRKSESAGGRIRLTVGGCYALEILEGFDGPTLGRVLEVLEGR